MKPSDPSAANFSRRHFLNQTIAASSLAGLGGLISSQSEVQAAPTQNNKAEKKHAVRFAHLTDTHVYSGRSAAKGMSEAFQHAQSHDTPPEFILTGGDAVMDTLATTLKSGLEQWKIWESVLKNDCSVPLHHCIGNHDVWGWDKKRSKTKGTEPGWGKGIALDQFEMKERYYTFDQAGWRFIVLDSIHYDENIIYRGELDQEQFEWFAKQLKNTPSTMPVIVISHIPILTASDFVFGEILVTQPHRRPGLSHQDNYKIMKLFYQHPNVKLCLSGHTHSTEVIQLHDKTFINSGAVCGLWWKGNHYHTSEGYNMIDLYDDGSFDHEYITYNWEAKK